MAKKTARKKPVSARPQKPRNDKKYEIRPPFPMGDAVADKQSKFARLTRAAPTEPDSERVFLASKLEMLRTHPYLSDKDRGEAESRMAHFLGLESREALEQRVAPRPSRKSAKKSPPVPGGVGYGLFYTDPFRASFVAGTAFYYEIACPLQPGGNVNTWLYLTAMNRAQRGVEAFVSYQGQNDTRFKVFDWARSDQWQTNIPLADLTDYLRSTIAHGTPLQVLLVFNVTLQTGPNQWSNVVFLHNRAVDGWDLIYQFDYPSTIAEQTTGFVGTWGPIVETFQNPYQNTDSLGFLNALLFSADANGQWDGSVLTSAQSTLRNDGQGFTPLFLDANYSFVVTS